jgi:hypothetical protein
MSDEITFYVGLCVSALVFGGFVLFLANYLTGSAKKLGSLVRFSRIIRGLWEMKLPRYAPLNSFRAKLEG